MPKVSFSVEGLRELEQKLKTLEPKKIRSLRFRNFKKMILAAMFRRMLNSGQYCCGHYRI
ncbi:hypothetical protein PsalBI1_04788 (plasmid) [Piscirickettsia salmonis]|nr:hypothetical protein PsalBI1_04788 [Piscirickettsia salmonis]